MSDRSWASRLRRRYLRDSAALRSLRDAFGPLRTLTQEGASRPSPPRGEAPLPRRVFSPLPPVDSSREQNTRRSTPFRLTPAASPAWQGLMSSTSTQ